MVFPFLIPISIFVRWNPIFRWNRSKNHSRNKLNKKRQLLWFCFAFITRNMATKSLSANKTAKNTHILKSPYNALQAQYWINVRHVCQWLVSLLMLYWFQLQNYFDKNKFLEMEGWCCWHYIYNCININVSKFLSIFSPIIWKASLRCTKKAAAFACILVWP